jgi:hypothetical protein
VRKLLGYACHVASVRLHEAAVGLARPRSNVPPVLWGPREDGDGYLEELDLADISPRLAAAADTVRDKLTNWRNR